MREVPFLCDLLRWPERGTFTCPAILVTPSYWYPKVSHARLGYLLASRASVMRPWLPKCVKSYPENALLSQLYNCPAKALMQPSYERRAPSCPETLSGDPSPNARRPEFPSHPPSGGPEFLCRCPSRVGSCWLTRRRPLPAPFESAFSDGPGDPDRCSNWEWGPPF